MSIILIILVVISGVFLLLASFRLSLFFRGPKTVWGGATFGVVIGIIVGWILGNLLNGLMWGFSIGTLVGVGAELLELFGYYIGWRRRRR